MKMFVKYLLRVLTLPAMAVMVTILAIRLWFVFMWRWLRWGGEIVTLDPPARKNVSDLIAAVTELRKEVAEGKRKDETINELLEALRDLADEQNGPPLERHKESWQSAVNRAYELLKTHET